MKLNCRPGDLAVIVADHKTHPDTVGLLCNVLHQSPAGDFLLPDGVLTAATHHPSWVIKLSRPVQLRWYDGIIRPATYASCPDSHLRPIRNDPGADETLTWCDVPDGVTA
jgi:hypothetical protein